MEKEKIYIEEEEENIVKAPFWWVEYVDDCGHKHIASIKNKDYVDFLKKTYLVNEIKVITE